MIRIAILTVSDSAANGTREDRSGPKLRERVEALGWLVCSYQIVPDESDEISNILRKLADSGEASVIFTPGGTGVALRDVTPEATRTVIEREIPGLGEVIRDEGRKVAPFGEVGRRPECIRGRRWSVNLQGS